MISVSPYGFVDTLETGVSYWIDGADNSLGTAGQRPGNPLVRRRAVGGVEKVEFHPSVARSVCSVSP